MLFATSAAARRGVLLSLAAIAIACDRSTAPRTGALSVVVSGLTAGVPAAVTVTGPASYTRSLDASATISDLPAGSYVVTAAPVTTATVRWVASPATQTVTVRGGETATAAVAYATGSGNLAVTITGVPTGAGVVVQVSGPNGFSRTIHGSATLPVLDPGSYTITAAHTSADGGLTPFSPSPASQTVQVSAAEAATATIAYAPFEIALEVVVSGLAEPTFLSAPPGDARLFVVEKSGRVRIVRGGQVLPTPFLDIKARISEGGERGLLSIAFDPGWATNGFFYVYYTDVNGDITVERYAAPPGADVAGTTGTTVITIPHRQAATHNGGLVAFGPDGMLYLGTGDGGGAGDQFGNAQNTSSLLGKLLRLDVHTLPYTIPADNPFANQAGARGEIWAYGLRNPWRFDFHTPTPGGASTLYVADVGQGAWEEIDVAPANVGGLNYGWSRMEGAHCYPPGSTCSATGLIMPAVEYDHSQGCSIAGGFVYRGSALPEVAGHYFYSDYCFGWLASMAGDQTRGFAARRWSLDASSTIGRVTSFGEDGAGELYVVNEAGTVYRMVRK